MFFRIISASILLSTLFCFGYYAGAESITDAEQQRLISFLKKRSGSKLPPDAVVKVVGYEKSQIQNFKRGRFIVTTSKGSGDFPFHISNDDKYLFIGDPVDTSGFKNSPVKGLKQGSASLGRQSLPVLVSQDGRYLVFNELVNISDPFKDVLSKISLKNVPIKGNKDAKITVVEYSDFQCPYCRKGSEIIPLLLSEYKGKVRFVFKQLPLPIHNWAKPAAIASVCAHEQGVDNFWEFHDLLFDNQRAINLNNSEEKFLEFAKKLKLNQDKFKKCLSKPETALRVEEDFKEAQELGVNSTPSFFVNGMLVQGADYQGIKTAIDLALSEGT
ncbi:MAG: DsbA family protein [Candidatus Dadabacteria bacterium]|nr:DsbA family protein [Candidatus Dadabacteria bacterium]